VEEAREAVLHAEHAVLNATAVFRGADEILNVGKSAYTDPYLVTTLLSIRLPFLRPLTLRLSKLDIHLTDKRDRCLRIISLLRRTMISEVFLPIIVLARRSFQPKNADRGRKLLVTPYPGRFCRELHCFHDFTAQP
jgi:hypothetical protein